MDFRKIGFLLLLSLILGCKAENASEPLRTTNQPPVIQAMMVNSTVVEAGHSMVITCLATDLDGDALTYDWTASDGEIDFFRTLPNDEGYDMHVMAWEAPYWIGEYTIKVGVSDRREADMDSVLMTVILPNVDPTRPWDPSPRNDELVDRPVTLRWKCSDPDGDTLVYDVYFGNQNGSMVAGNLDSTFYQLTELDSASIYTWSVRARDKHNNSTTSTTWRFVTR